jgi:ABC-type Na+ transport system ATPase subunit NatA
MWRSTLVCVPATLPEPDEGSISLADIDVLNQKDEVRQTLGCMPEEFGVYMKVSAERLREHFTLAPRKLRASTIGRANVAPPLKDTANEETHEKH